MEGADEGSAEGIMEGMDEGTEEGTIEGCEDGILVGKELMVGAKVGAYWNTLQGREKEHKGRVREWVV